MRTFGELNRAERQLALIRAKELLISHIIEGVIEVEMPTIKSQLDFSLILFETRSNDTMHLAKSSFLKNEAINKELDRISLAAAQGSWYDDVGGFLMDNQ